MWVCHFHSSTMEKFSYGTTELTVQTLALNRMYEQKQIYKYVLQSSQTVQNPDMGVLYLQLLITSIVHNVFGISHREDFFHLYTSEFLL